MRRSFYLIFTATVICIFFMPNMSVGSDDTVLNIGSRLELFVDDYLIESMKDARLILHKPVQREVVIVHDEPWEGNASGYHTIFQDGDIYRMYYNAWHLNTDEEGVSTTRPLYYAYAESRDGINWVKPELGLFEFKGTKENNIVWSAPGFYDFTPFKDMNPDCKPDARYKAVGLKGLGNLFGYKSPDGINWTAIQDKPIMTGAPFDSQNLAFWDTVRKEYRVYIRDWHSIVPWIKGRKESEILEVYENDPFWDGVRSIKTATSKDFIHWTEPVWLKYPGSPEEALYTNQIKPYYRAPHIFIGFPARYIDRGWSQTMKALPELEERQRRSLSSLRYGAALTDGLFMTSRDGVTFKRWGEAFIRPGLRFKDNWTYADNFISLHIVKTKSDIEGAPNELSIYATEGCWRGKSNQLRRYTIRIDGFVSVNAPMSGGEFTTKPFIFKGKHLFMNFSTSAAGSIRIEIQDAEENPIKGFTLEECPEIFGDSLNYIVFWNTGGDVSSLSGKQVRLRFVMKDADLYSIRFRPKLH